MIKKLFQGFSAHRYKDNPLEKRFAKTWQEENDTTGPIRKIPLLAYMLSHEGSPPEPSEHDFLVANTVVQWLGSPVGQGWLRDTLGVKWLKQAIKELERE